MSRKKEKIQILQRPRRNRKSAAVRALVRETRLCPSNFVLPLFVTPGKNRKSPIASMPGIFRLSPDLIVREAREAWQLGIRAVALFPVIADKLKTPSATESLNPQGLLPQAVARLKNAVPEMLVITDVAMDPYSSDGHDGVYRNGQILNDETLEILGRMAVCQAKAGADFVGPSDMMDGRIGWIRRTLDQEGFQNTGILAYSAKYASAFYGPFRDALDSAPRSGDKKTYQMDPSNAREAVREVLLDIKEGADIVMIKPALPYLDVIARIKEVSTVPVAAYNVSGEYAMVKAAAARGWVDEKKAAMETLTSFKRAGADIIISYWAKDFARNFLHLP